MKLRLPRLGDALIAVALFALGLTGALSVAEVLGSAVQGLDVWGILLAGAATLTIAWRQRYPRAVLWITVVAWMAYVGLGYVDGTVVFGVIIAIYSAALYLPRPTAYRHGAAVLIAMLTWTITGIIVYPDGVNPLSLAQLFIALVVPFAIGLADNRRHARMTELEVAHERRDQAQRAAAADAVRAERARIARELHDVVAHEMTVMTLQAEGAKRMLGDREPRVSEALGTISESGRTGLAEMQRMIGVLRATEQDAALAAEQERRAAGDDPHATPVLVGGDDLTPMPSLAALPSLVQQVEDAGLPVHLEVTGSAHVPAGVELSAYRIVQESLTNAMKHAGPGARATVTVRRRRDEVAVTVEDDGRGVISDAALASGGHGLAGMRERVGALGGTLEHGVRRGGGYRVHAVLPSSDDQVATPRRGPTRKASA